MGRKQIGLAIAVAALAAVGVSAGIASGGSGSTTQATKATLPPQTAPASAATGVGGPEATITGNQGPRTPAAVGGPIGAAPAIILPAHPTVEDVRRVLDGITAQILAPATSTASTQPLTKEQVETRIREQLKQLGINY